MSTLLKTLPVVAGGQGAGVATSDLQAKKNIIVADLEGSINIQAKAGTNDWCDVATFTGPTLDMNVEVVCDELRVDAANGSASSVQVVAEAGEVRSVDLPAAPETGAGPSVDTEQLGCLTTIQVSAFDGNGDINIEASGNDTDFEVIATFTADGCKTVDVSHRFLRAVGQGATATISAASQEPAEGALTQPREGFILAPYKTPGGNVYQNSTDLEAAMAGVVGVREIQIDDRDDSDTKIGPVTLDAIDHFEWRDAEVYGSSSFSRVEVIIPEGCTFSRSVRAFLRKLVIRNQATATVPITPSTAEPQGLYANGTVFSQESTASFMDASLLSPGGLLPGFIEGPETLLGALDSFWVQDPNTPLINNNGLFTTMNFTFANQSRTEVNAFGETGGQTINIFPFLDENILFAEQKFLPLQASGLFTAIIAFTQARRLWEVPYSAFGPLTAPFNVRGATGGFEGTGIRLRLDTEFGDIYQELPTVTPDGAFNVDDLNTFGDGYWLTHEGGDNKLFAVAQPGEYLDGVQSVQSSGVLTGVANFADGETVTIGAKTYTFKSPFVDAADNVAVGVDLATSLDNLKNAINGGPGAGTAYGTGTTPQGQGTAISDATTLTFTATIGGSQNDAIATTETGASASWGAATLTGGAGEKAVPFQGTMEYSSTTGEAAQPGYRTRPSVGQGAAFTVSTPGTTSTTLDANGAASAANNNAVLAELLQILQDQRIIG